MVITGGLSRKAGSRGTVHFKLVLMRPLPYFTFSPLRIINFNRLVLCSAVRRDIFLDDYNSTRGSQAIYHSFIVEHFFAFLHCSSFTRLRLALRVFGDNAAVSGYYVLQFLWNIQNGFIIHENELLTENRINPRRPQGCFISVEWLIRRFILFAIFAVIWSKHLIMFEACLAKLSSLTFMHWDQTRDTISVILPTPSRRAWRPKSAGPLVFGLNPLGRDHLISSLFAADGGWLWTDI